MSREFYNDFGDWWDELVQFILDNESLIENYGARSERFYDTFRDRVDPAMIAWLEAAFDCGASGPRRRLDLLASGATILSPSSCRRTAQEPTMSGVTKVTVNLPNEVIEQLKALAAANNTTLTDTIKRSIELNKYLTDREKEGGKLLIETPDKKFQQIIRK